MLNDKKDTIICFSITQAKYLEKQVYKVRELDTLYSICNSQIANKKAIQDSLKKNILDYQRIIANDNQKFYLKENEVNSLKATVSGLNRQLRGQKVAKWLAIGIGGALSGYLGYKYVTK